MQHRPTLILVVVAGLLTSLFGTRADAQPTRPADALRIFGSVAPATKSGTYGIAEPAKGGDIERLPVSFGEVFVETFLPLAKGDVPLPERFPTILFLSPYAALEKIVEQDTAEGEEHGPHEAESHRRFMKLFVTSGYAVSFAHVPGTGKSDGCFDWTGPNEVAAAEAALRYLGRDAWWTNGHVGMLGNSADGRASIAAAALADPSATRYLKAIVPMNANTGMYDWSMAGDGVPITGWTAANASTSNVLLAAIPDRDVTSDRPGAYSFDCLDDATVASTGWATTGNYDDYAEARNYRNGADNVTAATLMFNGQGDWNIQSWAPLGFFDRIPESTDKVLVLGQWSHFGIDWENPQENPYPLEQFEALVHGWMDRYLLGLDTGVDDLPRTVTQDNLGGWNVIPQWPTGVGHPYQLALSADGALGTQAPQGRSAYSEPGAVGLPGRQTFTSQVFEKALHITGVPVVDLWVSSDTSDAHIAATLEILGPDGEPIAQEVVAGARSIRHRDPMPNYYFTQRQDGYTTGELVRVVVRLNPIDLVVPSGHHLRLTVSPSYESVANGPQYSDVSGTGATVTVVHDCALAFSALRFTATEEHGSQVHTERTGNESHASRGRPTGQAPICGLDPVDPLDVLAGRA